MKKPLLMIFIFLLSLIYVIEAQAQYGRLYQGPDDPAGDKEAERTGFMNGNNVYLFFRNTTELSDCCGLGYWVSRWPADYRGSKMHDGIVLLIGARVYVANGSTPVTDPNEIRTRTDLDTLYYCQSSFREFMDKDPSGNIEWGFYPVFGYFNEASPNPAMSNKPASWPPDGWPAIGDEKKWPGVWNGRFGLGIMKADLETYFVVNDAQDQENLEPQDTVKYYPRPGVKIGDKRPQVTIQRGFPWGGIGIRVETRGFQWKNPEAADGIFWEYTIANISDYDLPEMYFGYQVDNAVGGEEGEGDDVAYYSKSLNMCYSWDIDGEMVGGGGVPGCMGIAFLESPGIPIDNIDNDRDGLIDEKRDNVAVQMVGATDGITSIPDFIEYYGKDDNSDGVKEFHFKSHWDADEDQDWQDGFDANGNGIYDDGEFPGDDVGTDGSGPYDLDYPGPDANGTECNHRPDLAEGIGSEPNFGFTDISESDMLGLTAFKYLLHWIAGTGGPRTSADDESIWAWLTGGNGDLFDDFQKNPQNFIEQFASGVFTLHKGRTERISLAELHAQERLHEQFQPPFSAPALFKLKETVQYIYESDYQFATPPLMPTLTAVPADGKVILSWDKIAEKFTREPLLGNINDFEGYKLYKSTDPFMSDDKIITDGFGTPFLIKPLFECDLVNGKTGFADYGEVNGQEYYLGSDKGITNYYVDTDVQNGKLYYYVLVAYDFGIESGDVEVGPSYNTYTLNIGREETVEEISKNVAIAIPHAYAAGYVPPAVIDVDYNSAFGRNTVQPEIVVPQFLKDGHRYRVKFASDTLATINNISHGYVYRNSRLLVYDITRDDSLVYEENQANFNEANFEFFRSEPFIPVYQHGWVFNTSKELRTGVFDGVVLRFRVPTLIPELDLVNSGWITGKSQIRITQHQLWDHRFFPYDYNIVFTDNAQAYTGKTRFATMKDEFFERMDASELLLQHPFSFYVETPTIKDSTGAPLKLDLVVHDVNKNGQFDWLEDRVMAGFLTDQGRRKGLWTDLAFIIDFQNVKALENLPKPGDVYHVTFNRGFWPNDGVTFGIYFEKQVNQKALSEGMDDIRVVPNPYVVSNSMEPAIGNWDRNQPRRLMFTHLPAQCTIKIFTVSGVLVDEIEVNNSVANRVSEWDTNSESNGIAHWNLRTKDGLDIAPGYYIYHVESKLTGDVKMGKFAVIK